MPSKNTPMTREQIETAIHGMVADAKTYLDAELSPPRAVATEYYQGKKFGNEESGRSQFILTDVRDTVLAMLPSLMRLFVPTSGHIIEYRARPKTSALIMQAVAAAKQATEYVNSVVLEIDNPGYTEFYGAFKDAMVRKLGTIKYWWEDTSSYKDYPADNLNVLEYEALVNNPDVEILKQSENKDADGLPRYSVTYRQWRREGTAHFSCVPPEEVLISRDARSRENAGFLAHRTEKTASELIEMGVPQSEIDEYGGPSSELQQSIEETARRGGISAVDKSPEPSLVKHLWIEAYPYLDVDGDGTAELVHLRCLGPGCHLVGEPDPVDERPFAFFCPDPEPHVLIGGSVADRVMDLQLMKSSVARAAADGLSDSIFPREYYMEDAVDPQQMESTVIGQKIPIRNGLMPQQAVSTITKDWKGQDALALINYLDAVKTQRIGPLPATLDPDSLQSTPEIGVKATVQAASEQLELIARNFTVGMKQLGKGLLKLLVEHQPKGRIVRLRGEYVEIDPKAWDADMDVSVNVAIGTQERLGVLAQNYAEQKAWLLTLGPSNPAVTVGQALHSLRTMLEIQGIPDVNAYWNELPPDWQPPPAPQAPDPNLLLAQAEMVKAQAKLQKDQADFQVAQVTAAQQMAELKAQLASKDAELQVQREKMHLDDDRQRDQTEAEIALGVAQINAQHQTALTVEQIRADAQAAKLLSDQKIARMRPKPNGTKKASPE